MAIEIDEIVVKARTGPPPFESDPSGKAPAGKEGAEIARDASRDLEKLKKLILSECREMVLEIFQDQKER